MNTDTKGVYAERVEDRPQPMGDTDMDSDGPSFCVHARPRSSTKTAVECARIIEFINKWHAAAAFGCPYRDWWPGPVGPLGRTRWGGRLWKYFLYI